MDEEQRPVEPETAAPAPEPAPAASPEQVVEALLFAADEPLPLARLAEVAGTEPERVGDAIAALNAAYADTGRTFRIHKVAQGYQLYTTAGFADWVRRLYQQQHVQRLSRAALEVLAIVAYNQPITRPEIEKLRTVDCSGPLLTLLERRLIATAGRAHRAGNPFLYRTTREFLRYFGLETIDDLPRLEELGEFLARRETGIETEDGEPPVETQTFESLAVDYRAEPDAKPDEPAPDA